MESNPSVSLSATQDSQSPTRGVSPQSPLKVILPHHLSGNSLPIRAPLSLDSDKVDSGSGSSSIGYSSSESEGFLSGEEDFETASERPFVADPDDEALEIDAEEEDSGDPFVDSVVGFSNIASRETLIPTAQVSGDDDDDDIIDEDLDNEAEDDGFSGVVRVSSVEEFRKSDGVVGTAEVRVLESEGGEDEPSLRRDSSAVEIPSWNGLSKATGLVAEKTKMVEEDCSLENHSLVGSLENGVLGSETAEPLYEKNPVSMELVENMAPSLTEAPVEALVAKDSEEGILPKNPKIYEGVKPTVKESSVVVGEEQEVCDLKCAVEDGKNGEVLDVGHSVSVDSTTGMDLGLSTNLPTEVEENGVSDTKELPVEKNAVLGGETDQACPIIEEPVDTKFVEADKDVNSMSNGGSSVVAEQPFSSELDAGVVRGAEDNKFSETKAVDFPVERSVTLGIESDQSTSVVEESVNLNLVGSDTDVSSAVKHCSSEKNLEPVMELAVEILKPVPSESKADVAEVEKYDYEKNGADVNGYVSLHPDNNSDNPELETEPQTFGAPSNETKLKLVADGVEPEPNDKVDVVDEAQTGDSTTKSAEPNSAEGKSQVLISESFSLLENSNTSVAAARGDELEDVVCGNPQTPESAIPSSIFDPLLKQEAIDEVNPVTNYEEEDGSSVSDEDVEGGLIFNGSESAEQIMKGLEEVSGISTQLGAESSGDHSQRIDGQIFAESDEDTDTDGEGDGKELFDAAALTALLKAATGAGSDGSNITITSPDGSRLFSAERPAGLGSSIRSLQPAHQPNRTSLFTPSDLMIGGESESNLSEEAKKMMEKIQLIRVKFLRLIQRLGHSPEDSIAGQVLHRMILAGRHTSQSFSLETAKRQAMQLETEGKNDLDFFLNILVIGKTGVGKSATINSILGEDKALINAFEPTTTAVKEIIGTVNGVKIRVFDTPGLRTSVMDQAFNQKVLSSVNRFTKKCPPDIVLYIDRLDTQTRDLNDLPLLRTITSTLGASIWRSAIVTLTHAASAPPDGPSGSPLSYEVFVARRSHVVQQSIGQAVGDMRAMNPSLMNPVSLAENHPSCRRNREGQKVLPNGQSWRSQLLLLCYSMKILSEVSSLSKPQDLIDPRKLFGFRVRSPPLPYLLSSLLQSRAHPKLPNDQGGENVDSDIDLGDLSDSDQEEEEDEYDQLPPFKPLRKSQIARLSKEQRKAYFDEYDYRVKLLQKKQWREELKRLKEMKKKGKNSTDNYGYMGEDVDHENGSPAAVPVPLPDMVLPPSFDGDNPAYRYRFLEPTSQLLARPVLDSHGWDHDCGYDGVHLEENIAIAGQFPAGVAVQITKDKKEFNIHLDSSIATKHGENGSTVAGFDIQTVGKQLAYILRGETKFKNLKKNKTAAGVSLTFLGENVATGLKIEDQIAIGKRLVLVGSSGAIRSQGDVAYGANLEARLKEKDYPIGQDQSTLGLSLMRWRGDLALGANLQSQFSIGRSSKIAVRVGLNNKLSGQITVRTSSSEQLQIALMGILPIANAIFRSLWSGAGESYPSY